MLGYGGSPPLRSSAPPLPTWKKERFAVVRLSETNVDHSGEKVSSGCSSYNCGICQYQLILLLENEEDRIVDLQHWFFVYLLSNTTMSISADEVNYLIYRYMQENGFSHSAFSFAHESLVAKSSVAYTDVPPGALITFLQKGLEYVSIEEHIGEDGSVREFENSSHSLLSPFICDAVAVKEDRRHRKVPPAGAAAPPAGAGASGTTGSDMDVDGGKGGQESKSDATHSHSSVDALRLVPSSVIVKGDATKKWLHLCGHTGEIFTCDWNPVDNTLASGSADGVCRLWNFAGVNKIDGATDTQVNIRSAILSHTAYAGQQYKDVTSIAWSPEGKTLATGCYDGTIRLWDNQGVQKHLLHEHAGPVFSLRWSKTGKYLLSGSHDRRTNVWNPTTGAVVKSYILHSGPVFDVDWLDDDIFASGSADKTILVCSASSSDGKPLYTFTGHEAEINAVRFSPDGQFLASCGDDNTAKVWSFEKGMVHDLRGHTKEVYTFKWVSPVVANRPLLCTASFDGAVKIWDATTGKVTQTLSRHNQAVYSLAPSPNGQLLAVGSLGGYVTVWKISDGTLAGEYRGNGDTFDVAWSADGAMLSSCYSSGSLRIGDASSL